MDKLDIRYEMEQLDKKNRNFYDELTDEERKKFSTFMMIRWGSSIVADGELQGYYLMRCNQVLNKDFFAINRHPKLQWLCATAISPNIGRQTHQWIALKKKSDGSKKIHKFLAKLFPCAKEDEIDLMVKLNDISDLRSLAREHGWSDKDIKSEL